jgi:hypothetical protein
MTRTRLLALLALVAGALLALRIADARGGPPDTLALPAYPAAPVVPASPTARAVPPASPVPSGTAVDWRGVLTALDRARAAAYAAPATADPDGWAAPACPCRAEDVRRLRALAAAGRALRGQATVLVDVRVTAATAARADLLVSDRLAAYSEVDARGRPVSRWPVSAVRRWRIRLVRTAGKWRLGAVERAP